MPFRVRKQALQIVGSLFGGEKRPCILQEGFSTFAIVPAIRKKVFQSSKTSLQLAGRFFKPRKRPCNLYGHFLNIFCRKTLCARRFWRRFGPDYFAPALPERGKNDKI